MQSSLGIWREVNMKRFHFMALKDFVWRKNTMLCVSPDAEVKQQDLSKGSKERGVQSDTGLGLCQSGRVSLRIAIQGRRG